MAGELQTERERVVSLKFLKAFPGIRREEVRKRKWLEVEEGRAAENVVIEVVL